MPHRTIQVQVYVPVELEDGVCPKVQATAVEEIAPSLRFNDAETFRWGELVKRSSR